VCQTLVQVFDSDLSSSRRHGDCWQRWQCRQIMCISWNEERSFEDILPRRCVGRRRDVVCLGGHDAVVRCCNQLGGLFAKGVYRVCLKLRPTARYSRLAAVGHHAPGLQGQAVQGQTGCPGVAIRYSSIIFHPVTEVSNLKVKTGKNENTGTACHSARHTRFSRQI